MDFKKALEYMEKNGKRVLEELLAEQKAEKSKVEKRNDKLSMIEIVYHDKIEFDYVNWKGETAHRKAEVNDFYYGSNAYHKEPQWLLHALDLDKGKWRTFAMKDMSNIKLIKP